MNIKNRTYSLIVLILIAILLSGCTLSDIFTTKDNSEYIYSGTAEADEINITSELPGSIKEIKVHEGQKIAAGDLVALIDSSESSIRQQISEINLINTQNELDKINEGSRTEDIKTQQSLVSQAEAAVKQFESLLKQSDINIASAQTNYDYKLELYKTSKDLYDKGAERQNTLDTAKNTLDNAKTALDNAVCAKDIANSQLNGSKAQLEAAKQKLKLLVTGATEKNKATAKYGVDIANKNYELSKIAVNKNNIVSASGGIVETINFKPGEYIAPGSPIATLLDTKNMYVKVYVPEKSLPLIAIGKDVIITSDFIKNKTIKGKIAYISPEAEFTPMNIVTKKDREKLVFAVKVDILDSIDSIKSGMLLDVSIRQ